MGSSSHPPSAGANLCVAAEAEHLRAEAAVRDAGEDHDPQVLAVGFLVVDATDLADDPSVERSLGSQSPTFFCDFAKYISLSNLF